MLIRSREACVMGPLAEEAMTEWSNAKICDVLNLILGAFLFVSP